VIAICFSCWNFSLAEKRVGRLKGAMTAEQFRLKFIVSKDGQTQMREKWLECES